MGGGGGEEVGRVRMCGVLRMVKGSELDLQDAGRGVGR